MRVFPDANILVAAPMWEDGLRAKIVDALLDDDRHAFILSDWVWEEVEHTLNRDFNVNRETTRRYREYLLANALTTRQPTPLALSPYPVADPDDRVVLAAALSAYADVLVTNDRALNAVADQVKQSEGMLIIPPEPFWRRRGNLW